MDKRGRYIEEYIKEYKIIEKTEIQKEIELIKTIIDTREKLKRDNKNFEYAQGDLVDYYTYQIKANQAKLDYLIKLAKTNGIQVDMVNDKKFTFLESEEAGYSNICPYNIILKVIRKFYNIKIM